MGQKTKRLISFEGGYFCKPTLFSTGSGQTINNSADQSLACDVLAKRTGFRFFYGTPAATYKHSSQEKEFLGGVKYPVDTESNAGKLKYHYRHAVFANFSHATSTDGKTQLEQTSGICQGVQSFNNKQSKSGNNGYVLSYHTTGPDYHVGASPMKVVGLCFKFWSIQQQTKWTYDGAEVSNGGKTAGDIFLNKMHLLYIKPNGTIYNKEVKPEGNNTGGVKFVLKGKLSDNYDDSSLWPGKEWLWGHHNLKSARKVRVWHNDDIPDGDCFIGFHLNWGMGKVADIKKWHNLIVGGLTPILQQDVSAGYVLPNNYNITPRHTACYMMPLDRKSDLYKCYPELDPDQDTEVKTRRLWTVSDQPLENDHGTTESNFKSKNSFYISSFSWAAGNLERLK